ncbi:hypothetical protein DMA11_09740 [Marinilabiliaceae bacterium JC017]|nr:hypothetical protein DMA11_09740 [Marinilabiliaceae bacterium JC017]
MIRKSLGAEPTEANTGKTWQEVVFERMSINPGFYRCCGGKMELVDSWPNQFRQRQRAPPLEVVTGTPNIKSYPGQAKKVKRCEYQV